MRIIDILNDYAKGKIKDGFKFRSGNYNWVIEEDGIHSINRYSNYADMGDYVYFEDCFDLSNLNDEVEIIEEKPEHIEELKLVSFEEFKTMTPGERYRVTIAEYDRINKLIKAVNYLLEKDNNG